VKLHFIDQAGLQVLLRSARAARQRYVLPARRAPGLIQRTLDPVGHEHKARAALHDQGVARVMRQHEHRVMKRRISTPPAVPGIRLSPRARTATEHIAAHDGRANVGKFFLHHRRALVHHAAIHAMWTPPSLQREYPLVQLLAANAEWLLQTLVRTGDKPVQRH
jgi:hypothetical protein